MSNETLNKNFPEQVTSFLKKKFKIIFSILIILFIFLFSFLFYNNIQEKNNIQTAEQYTQALILINQKKTEDGKMILENIISQEHQFYSPLALYLIIDKNIENDTLKIITLFDEILDNNSIDNENLNLIKIKKAIYLINFNNEKLIIETLNSVINSNSVWKNLAINIISEYFISNGQNVKANEYIQLLDKNSNK
ncbi:hypothetical protein OAB44_00195 [Pelagibacteraceae bacterium]|nr:hypothetical protein [Pelagibacteraceae bacterium]